MTEQEKLQEITDKLEEGVQAVFKSDKYKDLLNTMAKFPRYSVNNNILIMMQKPDATLCQGYNAWKKMERNVKRGEKGIRIIAPTSYTVQKEVNKTDAGGNVIYDKDGEPVKDTVEMKLTGFKVTTTFDISQTEGKDLPSLGVSELKGSVENFQAFMDAIKSVCPVPIGFEDIKSGAKGYYHTEDKRIAIQSGMSELQTLKTALHEMSHQILHADKDNKQSKSSKEVEAESVAYTVCKRYGLDTSDYSFSYVASWSDGKDAKELKASLGTIQKTAGEIIAAIDEKLKDHQLEKGEVQKPVEEAKPLDENKIVAEKKPMGYIKVVPEKRPSVLAKLKAEKLKIKLRTEQKNENKEAVINGR